MLAFTCYMPPCAGMRETSDAVRRYHLSPAETKPTRRDSAPYDTTHCAPAGGAGRGASGESQGPVSCTVIRHAFVIAAYIYTVNVPIIGRER